MELKFLLDVRTQKVGCYKHEETQGSNNPNVRVFCTCCIVAMDLSRLDTGAGSSELKKRGGNAW